MIELAPTNEILGSMLANGAGQISELKADPKAYIYSHYNLEIPADVQLAENTDKQVHLTLPYYSAVDKVTAEKQNDQQIDLAGGFEFWAMAICIGAGVTAGVAGTAAAVGGIAGGHVASKK